jgi:hypothetical protein
LGYDLDEALTLLGDLKTRATRSSTAVISRWSLVWRLRSGSSAVSLASTIPMEASMAAEPLRATESARLLGVPTRDLLGLIHERKIRYVMIDGIAHVPADAIDEYPAKAS